MPNTADKISVYANFNTKPRNRRNPPAVDTSLYVPSFFAKVRAAEEARRAPAQTQPQQQQHQPQPPKPQSVPTVAVAAAAAAAAIGAGTSVSAPTPTQQPQQQPPQQRSCPPAVTPAGPSSASGEGRPHTSGGGSIGAAVLFVAASIMLYCCYSNFKESSAEYEAQQAKCALAQLPADTMNGTTVWHECQEEWAKFRKDPNMTHTTQSRACVEMQEECTLNVFFNIGMRYGVRCIRHLFLFMQLGVNLSADGLVKIYAQLNALVVILFVLWVGTFYYFVIVRPRRASHMPAPHLQQQPLLQAGSSSSTSSGVGPTAVTVLGHPAAAVAAAAVPERATTSPLLGNLYA